MTRNTWDQGLYQGFMFASYQSLRIIPFLAPNSLHLSPETQRQALQDTAFADV
jgi:hypothetical protein